MSDEQMKGHEGDGGCACGSEDCACKSAGDEHSCGCGHDHA